VFCGYRRDGCVIDYVVLIIPVDKPAFERRKESYEGDD